MISDIDDYFAHGCGRCDRFATPACSVHQWAKGLAHLRQLCQEAGLEEAVKWGHPCYVYGGRNIVIFGAFRSDFRLTFFNPALMKDPEAVFERKGPNTRHPSVIRFSSSFDVTRMASIIAAYLAEAKEYATKGIKPPKEDHTIELPAELLEALDGDPDLAEAFAALTPGRQKSYAIAIGSAKKPETRFARIEKFRDKIFAGKGAMDR